MARWFYWKTPPLDGPLNMAWDEICLTIADQRSFPVLRFYAWNSPATTFGYFQRFEAVRAQSPSVELIRRPTGGGIVPHENDWTYSVVIPPEHPWYRWRAPESYRFLHSWIQRSFTRLDLSTSLCPAQFPEGIGSCFIGAEKDDLLYQGRKLAGAAQRRTRHGLLIQGSIQPPPPDRERDDWELAMLETLKIDDTGVDWEVWSPTSELSEQSKNLATTKYADSTYNQRR